jgi:hypothetical protein
MGGDRMAWHRKLIAKKYDGSASRLPGRPRTVAEVEALVVRMAEENPDWGYHLERNHQGLGNRLIMPMKGRPETTGDVRWRRLGGLLNYYYRKAA